MLLPGSAQPLPNGTITVDGALYRALLEEPPEPRDPRSPIVFQDRDVALRWDGRVLRVTATWSVRARERTWLHQPLSGAIVRVDRVRVDGVNVETRVEDRKTWLLTELGPGTHRVVLEGAIEADPTLGALSVPLLPAVVGRVRTAAPEGLVITVGDAIRTEDRWLTTASTLSVAVGPPTRRARDRRTLAVGSAGVGLTVDDGAVIGRGQLRWTLRQGELTRVVFRATGTGPDLEVTGTNVGRVERQGDRVVVTLREPETARVELDLTWTVPVPPGETSRLPVPRIMPEGAFRTEASVQFARAGSLDLLPELDGWQPVAASDLPDWGDDLVTGTPTAAYRAGAAGRGGTLGLLRFVPATQPPVVVDVASLTIATSAEGRALTRALYTVRNERASHLAISPPEGTIILGARVDDGPVTPVTDGARWLVPLPRSLETLDGLVSFPVEVVLLGDGTPWVRKEERELPLPVVDAPVAVNRVTLHLPPTFDSQLELGEAGTVEDFTEGEGIAYGFGLGGEQEARADQIWQEAQAAWMRNDFDQADEYLDTLEDMGASNANVGKLRSNLDVLQGRAGGAKARTVGARRVREQAKSRGLADYRAQEELLREAEQQLSSGDYGNAQQTYEKVAELAKKLDKLEQAESVEQKARADLARSNVAQASAGLQLQGALSGTLAEDPNTDQRVSSSGASGPGASAERARALGRLESLADPDRAGLVSRFADGQVSVQGRLSFEPAEGEDSTIVSLREAIEEELTPEDSEGPRTLTSDLKDTVTSGVELESPPSRASRVRRARAARAQGASVGGSGAGSVGGITSSDDDEVPESIAAAEVRSLDNRRSIKVLERRGGPRSLGRRGPKRARQAAKPRPSPPPKPAPSPDDTFIDFDEVVIDGELRAPSLSDAESSAELDVSGAYQREALEVTSTRLSVVIPVQGQTLRYQHLLLPASARHAVRIEARSTERHIPRRLP